MPASPFGQVEFGELPPSLVWFMAIWLFEFGACVGSFLNVVIYRTPIGLPLWKPNSHCPNCKTEIRWFDNLPILSWLLLRGRCRQCRIHIPRRYPTVELLIASVFVLFGVFEALGGGSNLPRRLPLDGYRVWLVFGLHMLLITTLIGAAYIRHDGKHPRWNLFAPAIGIGLALGALFPFVHPVGGPWLFAAFPLVAGAAESLIGFLTGMWLGFMFQRLAGETCLAADGQANRRAEGLRLEFAICGLVLGWQAITLLAVGVAAWSYLKMLLPRNSLTRAPDTAVLSALVIVFLFAWGAIDESSPALTSGMSGLNVVAVSAAIIMIGWLRQDLTNRRWAANPS